MKKDERVLVVPNTTFVKCGYFLGFCRQPERYWETLMQPENQAFSPRSHCETDPSLKQLVPYIVLRSRDQVFGYRRGKQGGEQRLHQKWSIGVGGHVCDDDGKLGVDAYLAGFRRELAEEIAIDSPYGEKVLGLVHDDRTPVGSVHLGIVHVLDLDEPSARPADPALVDAGFRPLVDWIARKDELESWSQFVLEALAQS